MLNKILYDNDKIINIDDFFGKITDLSFHFFLCMIINYNKNVINYSFSINYIRQIHDLKENCNNKVYKKLILSKIILELIDIYKSSYDYYKIDKKELNEIENKTKIDFQTINNIDLIINEKDLISKRVEELYIKIIYALIENKKLEDQEYIYDIINQLDLDNIIITKKMFQQLSLLLNSNNKFVNDYILISIDDLFDFKKVNFYYILFKYILKSAIYIYQNDFLNETRKTIIKIIHFKSDKFNTNLYDLYKENNILTILPSYNENELKKERIYLYARNFLGINEEKASQFSKEKILSSQKLINNCNVAMTIVTFILILPLCCLGGGGASSGSGDCAEALLAILGIYTVPAAIIYFILSIIIFVNNITLSSMLDIGSDEYMNLAIKTLLKGNYINFALPLTNIIVFPIIVILGILSLCVKDSYY